MIASLKQILGSNKAIDCTVRVRPNALMSKIVSVMADGTLKIDLHAPAEDGKANTELVRFLATEFGVDRSTVTILSGQTNRKKMIRIKWTS